jgi:class 3 adenylate cyclase/tetratricopeptide (TPR) repeat protein
MAQCAQCGTESAENARFCSGCGASLELPAPQRRKLATMLFCDVSGSTALGERLDPESVREIMLSYFEEMRHAIERHGGTVEKFIGDAVMAVFGVPVSHEDDAVRAIRAASEMRERLVALNEKLDQSFGVRLSLRIGLNSGEVVAEDTGRGEAVVTGDAVNVAARLEEAASPGEILVGESTYRLARHAAVVEPVEPIQAKGKSEPVRAHRLLSVVARSQARLRPRETPMVARTGELAALRAAFTETVSTRTCRVCVVVGEAGIGKSRLAAEFVSALPATVLHGRCLSYGEGITYWPLAEIVRQAAAIRPGHSVDAALERISALVATQQQGPRIALLLAQALGLAEGSASGEDIAWATRRFAEALAEKRPLVICFDDLQWAEPSFLDVVESAKALSKGAPILFLGLARPEFLYQRPEWEALRLEPFAEAEAEQLVVGLAELDEKTRARVIGRAGGNPLFVEELVAAIVEEPGLKLPPTLDALLGARLDRLSPVERAVTERGAVEGQVFHRSAVVALSDGASGAGIGAALETLVAAEFVRPTPSSLTGDVAFSFRHILIRDAAYRGIAKKDRAELHERFASWLLGAVGERVAEYEEVLGYHLEQSYRCRFELGSVGERGQAVGARAAEWLASAGRRAFARGDMAAAAGLLRRAADLLGADPLGRLELLPDLAKARRFAGDRSGAEAALREAIEQSAAAGDRRLTMLSRVEYTFMRLYTDRDVETEEAIGLAGEAVGVFTELGDVRGLAQAWALVGHANWLLCHGARMEEAFGLALECARRAGDPREQGWILRMLALVYYHGPTPVERAIERCEEILREGQGHTAIEISTRAKLAGLEAMRGRLDVARELYMHCRAVGEEFGVGPVLAALPNYSGPIEVLAGDLEAAERELRAGYKALQALGETSTLSTNAALLARTLEFQGRLDEAESFTVVSEQTAPRDDLASQTTWRGVRARVLARRGELEQAEQLAREAVAIGERTDFLVWRGEALLDLAEVLRLGGDAATSRCAAERALRLFRAKGHVVLADRTRILLEAPAVERRPA